MSARSLRVTAPGAVLAFAAALVLAAGPSHAGMPDMDDPLDMKVAGRTGDGAGQTAGRKLSKKAQRLKARLGGNKIGTPSPPNVQAPRVPTFRAPMRRPAPRVVRRVPHLSLQRR